MDRHQKLVTVRDARRRKPLTEFKRGGSRGVGNRAGELCVRSQGGRGVTRCLVKDSIVRQAGRDPRAVGTGDPAGVPRAPRRCPRPLPR